MHLSCGWSLTVPCLVCVCLQPVIRSKCPSYVGTTGILVQEFKHVFKIITEEDKMKGEQSTVSSRHRFRPKSHLRES